MKQVEIEIYNIASTKSNYDEMRKWIDDLGAPDYEIPRTKNDILDGKFYCQEDTKNKNNEECWSDKSVTTDSARLIGMAGKRCYLSFGTELNPNISRVRNDWAEYLDNVMKSGHGSVLEHSYYSFAIEGVSRVFTSEMNRHRAGVAISEGSMRYIRFEDIPFWMPLSIRTTEEENKFHTDVNRILVSKNVDSEMFEKFLSINKKIKTQRVFKQAFQKAEDYYKELLEIWKEELAPESKFHLKKELTSMMRRIIPMGVATGGVWTGNIRALRHMITMRADKSAEEEICYVFSHIAKYMVENEPMLFGDFHQDEYGFWSPSYRKI